MTIHDIALTCLILLFIGTVLGVRILWDIYKTVLGFWRDYRIVNRLEEFDSRD